MLLLLLITQVGFKPSPFALYETKYLTLAELDGASNEVATPELTINKADNSWKITEPIGGILGGIVGGIILANLGTLVSPPTDDNLAGWLDSGAPIGLGSGYLIGSGLGIWAAGKHIEKENGKWYWPVIGSVLGCAIGGFGGYVINRHDFGLVSLCALAGSLTGGVILYRGNL